MVEDIAMNNNITFEKLIDWVEGRLSGTEAEWVANQIDADPALQADVNWIRGFQKISQQIVWEAPSPEVRQNLSQRFAIHMARNRPAGLWRQLVTTLKFDSQLQPIVAGFRASAAPSERQLVYQTELTDVALTVQQHPSHQLFTVMGHILPTVSPMPDIYSVQLVEDELERGFLVTNTIGEFVFEGLPKGEYELTIHSDHYEMVISLQLTL